MFSKIQKVTLLVLFFFATFAWYVVFHGTRNELRVAVLDVGQGDAIFIETPSGHQMLIDGGYGSRVLSALGKVMPAYDKSIDVVVSTHTDADHLSGLVDVLKQYDVSRVFDNNMTASTTIFANWQQELVQEHMSVEHLLAGDRIDFGDGVHFDILGPWPEDFNPIPKTANEAMIVGRLVYKDKTFLLTGDLERGDELRLVDSNAQITSDVLKVAHHGSKYASTDLFLQKVHPSIEVISVGAQNRYGHPAPETLDRLGHTGAQILRTDQEGTVIFSTDGHMLRTEVEKAQAR